MRRSLLQMRCVAVAVFFLANTAVTFVDSFTPQQHQQQSAVGWVSSTSSPTRSGKSRPSVTQRSALRDPQIVSKLTSTWGTSTVAFPMVIASTAPFGLNDWMATTTSTLERTAATTSVDAVASTLQAEVLNDFAHVALDLVTLSTASSVFVRAAAVLGRIMSMAADYIPDHSVLPDELFFQVIMLVISWVSLLQAALPRFLAATSLSSLQLRDGKAYSALFAPTGMSWQQFKTVAACAMDWIDIEPHQDIPVSTDNAEQGEDGEYVYWLFSGDMIVQNSQGKDLYTVRSAGGGQRLRQDAARGVLGEAGLLQRLEKDSKKKMFGLASTIRASLSNGTSWPSKVTQAPQAAEASAALKAKAGSSGATLLRLHVAPLGRLVRHDDDLATSLRTLLFQGLSTKLTAHLEASTSRTTARLTTTTNTTA